MEAESSSESTSSSEHESSVEDTWPGPRCKAISLSVQRIENVLVGDEAACEAVRRPGRLTNGIMFELSDFKRQQKLTSDSIVRLACVIDGVDATGAVNFKAAGAKIDRLKSKRAKLLKDSKSKANAQQQLLEYLDQHFDMPLSTGLV